MNRNVQSPVSQGRGAHGERCQRDYDAVWSVFQIVSLAAMPPRPTAQHSFPLQATPSRKGLSGMGVQVFPPSWLISLPVGPTTTAVSPCPIQATPCRNPDGASTRDQVSPPVGGTSDHAFVTPPEFGGWAAAQGEPRSCDPGMTTSRYLWVRPVSGAQWPSVRLSPPPHHTCTDQNPARPFAIEIMCVGVAQLHVNHGNNVRARMRDVHM